MWLLIFKMDGNARVTIDSAVPVKAREQINDRVRFLAKALVDIFPSLRGKLQIHVDAPVAAKILAPVDGEALLERGVWDTLQLLCADILPLASLRTPVCLLAECSQLAMFGAGGYAPLTIGHVIYRVRSEWNTPKKNDYVLFWILKEYATPQTAAGMNCFCREWVTITQGLVESYVSGRQRDLSIAFAGLVPGTAPDEITARVNCFCGMPVVPSYAVQFSREQHGSRAFLRARVQNQACPFTGVFVCVVYTSHAAFPIISHSRQGQEIVLLHEFLCKKKSSSRKRRAKEPAVFQYVEFQPFEFVPMKITRYSCQANQLQYPMLSSDVPMWRKISLMLSLDIEDAGVCTGVAAIRDTLMRPLIQIVMGRPLSLIKNEVSRRYLTALCLLLFSKNIIKIGSTRSLMFQITRKIPQTHWLHGVLHRQFEIARAEFVAAL
jgi:hypothetical protein